MDKVTKRSARSTSDETIMKKKIRNMLFATKLCFRKV